MSNGIQYALRSLRRRPGFSLLAVVVLGIAIGISTAIASICYAVLIRPLAMREPDRVIALWAESPARQFTHFPLQFDQYQQFVAGTKTLDQVAAMDYNGVWPRLFEVGDRGLRLKSIPVSGAFFEVLGASPLLGRTFNVADDLRGGPGVLVLSYAAWQSRFGGDTGILGRSLDLVATGQSVRIIGVMPPAFGYPSGAEGWLPLLPTTTTLGVADPRILVHIVGRLESGVPAEAARGELDAFIAAMQDGGFLEGTTAAGRSVAQLLLGDVRPVLRILAAAVVLLLGVACINVANLLLIRGVERARETAVRSALGASTSRLTKELFTEHALLGGAAGVVGMLVAVLAMDFIVALAPAGLPRLSEIRVDLTTFALTFGISVIATLLVGLGPAVWAARREPGLVLGTSRGGTDSTRVRVVKDVLVVGQVALALLVVASAGLVTRSLVRLLQLDPGMATKPLLVVQLGWPAAKYGDGPRILSLYHQIASTLRDTPGVEGVQPLITTPFAGAGGWDGMLVPEGRGAEELKTVPVLNLEAASPGFFEMIDVPVQQGRGFLDSDRDGAPKVAVISQAAARGLWPGADAVGRRLKFGPEGDEWWTVVGVVGETRYREFLVPRPTIYFPIGQWPFGSNAPSMLLIRSANPVAIVPAVRSVVAAIDPDVIVSEATPMTTLLDAPLAQPRLNALLLAVFAAVILVLAALGLYGVLAWTVRQRTREIGIRMALGAEPRAVRMFVLGRGMRLAAAGAGIGLVAAMATGNVIQALLFEVSPLDPLSLSLAAALLVLVATIAAWVPARRATRIDPASALRAE